MNITKVLINMVILIKHKIIGIVFTRPNNLTVRTAGNCSFIADTFCAAHVHVWMEEEEEKTWNKYACSIVRCSEMANGIGYIQQLRARRLLVGFRIFYASEAFDRFSQWIFQLYFVDFTASTQGTAPMHWKEMIVIV